MSDYYTGIDFSITIGESIICDGWIEGRLCQTVLKFPIEIFVSHVILRLTVLNAAIACGLVE